MLHPAGAHSPAMQHAELHGAALLCSAAQHSALLSAALLTLRFSAQRCLDKPCVAPRCTALPTPALPLPRYRSLHCTALHCITPHSSPPPCPSLPPSLSPLEESHPIRIAGRLRPAPVRYLRPLIGWQHLHGDAVDGQPKMAAEPGGGCRGAAPRSLLAALTAALLLCCGRTAGLSPFFSSSSCQHRVPGRGEVRPRGSSGGAGRGGRCEGSVVRARLGGSGASALCSSPGRWSIGFL